MLTLLGVLVVVIGFTLRLNPLLVVLAAGMVTGLASGMSLVQVISAFGKAFTSNRYMAVGWLVLPVVGVLERAGLRERAEQLVRSIQVATAGRILLVYFVIRQAASALGLTSLGGHAQMVRPLIAPMVEAAAERQLGGEPGSLPDRVRFWLRAHAAGADNIALFFGEDIFIAIGSILLMKGFLAQSGFDLEPLSLAVWAIPTALLALVIHGTRLIRIDRRLAKEDDAPKENEASS